jgi:SEC-C motif-containing protein
LVVLTNQALNACPCGGVDTRGRPLALAACCGRYLDHETPAPDAKCLMRSRYTAFVLNRPAYLLATWHASTRPAELVLDPAAQWLGLTVRHHKPAGERAEVEFVARSRSAGAGGGQAQRLHERSRFVREGGRWFYLNGDLL